MKMKLSTNPSLVIKYILPLFAVPIIATGLLFGILFLVNGLTGLYKGTGSVGKSLLAPIFMIFVPVFLLNTGYRQWRDQVKDVLDNVWLDGDEVYLIKGERKVSIHIHDIERADYDRLNDPPRITLKFKTPNVLGDSATFNCLSSWVPFRMRPEIKKFLGLINRSISS